MNSKNIVYSKSLSSSYNTFHSLPSNFLNLQIEKILKYLSIDINNDVVLDAGCGSGRLLIPLSKYVPVIGVEKSSEMMSLIPKADNRVLINLGYKEFLSNAVEMPFFNKVYFSFSLHQIGENKLDQCHILQRTLDITKDKLLVISLSKEQFSEININNLFPSISKIDEERFIFKETLESFFNLEMIEQQAIYSKLNKMTFKNMLEQNYISTLQLISKEEKEEGIKRMLMSTSKEFIRYCDCFTYYLISAK
jgi:ubiquinone/menaquinone biosynthesis C-methylase UbiE